MEENKMVSPDDLGSPDPYIRLLAVRALGEGVQITQHKRPMMGRSSKSVEKAPYELLIPLLSDEDQLVRVEAAWVLGEQDEIGADTVQVLAEVLSKDDDEDVRIIVAHILGKHGGVEAKNALIKHAMARDSSIDVRLEVVRALGRLLASQPRRTTLGGSAEEEVETTLRQVAESDPNPVLRRVARVHLERVRMKAQS